MAMSARNESLEAEYPNLASSDYRITSPRNPEYNCFAWAAEEDDRWWSPTSEDYYWPEDAPTAWDTATALETLIQTFALSGYKPCDSADFEPGIQKVAIYIDSNGMPTHMARQLSEGRWTSKLGGWEDIEHELAGVEGMNAYGSVYIILGRSTLEY
jgi:hypothetical protein